MSSIVKRYDKLNISRREVQYYAKCSEMTPEVETIMNECIEEVAPLLQPQLCYGLIDRTTIESFFEHATEDSAFRAYMEGCDSAILFTATLGFGFDRLIARHEKLSMAKAQMLQAIGAQQVEELCDRFCAEMKELHPTSKPRYSPGFGGLSLTSQGLIFGLLQVPVKIGVSLNSSYLMSPSKSVSAFIAIR